MIKILIQIQIIFVLIIAGIEPVQSAELFGTNFRPPAETRTRVKVNRYRNTAQAIDPNCNCNPGIYTVVYLTNELTSTKQLHTDTVSMSQKDMRFEPSVIVVEVGSIVEFPNLDPYFHNVFSYSKTKKFDLGKFPKGETSLVTFDKPGLVKVFCEIHSSMRAYVHVLETPYFAVSDKDGKFKIENIDIGEYTLHLWQENLSEHTEQIKIQNDSTYIEVRP